jgi:hypothetical protein
METIANIIIGLAWPAVTLWLAYLLRPEIKTLLERLSALKVAGGEAVFGKSLERAESEAIQLPKDVLPTDDNTDGIAEKLGMLRRIAEISPRAAIMEAWTLIETAALPMAVPADNKRRIPPIHFLHHVVTTAKLSQESANLIISLRNLRNQAAHLPDFALTSEEAERYLELAVTVTKLIEKRIQAGEVQN